MSTSEYTYTKEDFSRLTEICRRYKTIHSRLHDAKAFVFPWVISYDDCLFVALLIDKIDSGENPFESQAPEVLRKVIAS